MREKSCDDIFKKPKSGFAFNEQIKNHARDKVYYDHHKEFYCNCDFLPVDNKRGSGKIDPTECGYIIKSDHIRGARLEWEHIVPASFFGNYKDSWKKYKEVCGEESLKGRDCARKTNLEFKMMEADLHNLVPAVGELNKDRSNIPYGIVSGEERKYGECDFEVSKGKSKFAEPADNIRGDIARTWLYMYMTYGNKTLATLTNQLSMFCQWFKDDPVNEWEIIRNSRIFSIQGNSNPYVDGTYKECLEVCGEIELSLYEL